MQCAKSKEKGFTFTEVLVTITIIIIGASIAIPHLQGYIINRNLESAARDVESSFYALREEAIAQNIVNCNNNFAITFDVANNDYTTTGLLSNCTTVSQTKSPAYFGNDVKFTSNIGAPCYSGASTTFNATGSVVFLSRGIMNPPSGTILLTNSRGSTATITYYLTGKTNVCFNLK